MGKGNRTRGFVRTWCMLQLAASVVSGQVQAPGATTAKVIMPGAIEGAVSGREGAEPLEHVVLTLHGLGPLRGAAQSTKTDMTGRFAFPAVAPGRYRLMAEREGFARAEYGARSPGLQGAELEVREGQKLQNITLQLLRHSVVTGRVTDVELRPLTNVNVRAVRETYRRGRREFAFAAAGVTDRNGEYAVRELAPGRYYLIAIPAGRKAVSRPGKGTAAGEPEYVPAFYPGVEDAASAIPLDIGVGMQLQRVEITLRAAETHRISGRVRQVAARYDSQSLAVYLIPAGDSEFASLAMRTQTVDNPEGRFEIVGVRPGEYVLLADSVGAHVRYASRERVVIGRSDAEVETFLTEAGRVSGRFRVEPRDADIKFSELVVQLESSDPVPLRRLTGKAGENGEFQIDNVVAGRLLLSVSGVPHGFYIKSLNVAGRETADLWMDIAPATNPTVEITLSASGGRITGSVVDTKQQCIPEATAILLPDRERRHMTHLHRKVRIDQRCSFQVVGVAPGRYIAFAVTPTDEDHLYDPAFMTKAERSSLSVTVEPNGTQMIELRRVEPN